MSDTVAGMKFYTTFDDETITQMIRYARMAKQFMNKPFASPLGVVGNFEWHEQFPYEHNLLFEPYASKPLINPLSARVIDFGCGPGRMINRIGKYLQYPVDGIDVSDYALEYARHHYPQSTFYTSTGIDLGECPSNTYDLVYSTIAMQHIPSRKIRENLFRGFYDILKTGGVLSIQMAYHPVHQAGVWSSDTEHAAYETDFWNAKGTNGHADVILNEQSLPMFKNDLASYGFSDISFHFVNVSHRYTNLNGAYHAPYWASDWIFVQGKK